MSEKLEKVEVNVPVSLSPHHHSFCLTINKSIINYGWPVIGKLKEKWNQLASAHLHYTQVNAVGRWINDRHDDGEQNSLKERIYDRSQWTLYFRQFWPIITGTALQMTSYQQCKRWRRENHSLLPLSPLHQCCFVSPIRWCSFYSVVPIFLARIVVLGRMKNDGKHFFGGTNTPSCPSHCPTTANLIRIPSIWYSVSYHIFILGFRLGNQNIRFQPNGVNNASIRNMDAYWIKNVRNLDDIACPTNRQLIERE